MKKILMILMSVVIAASAVGCGSRTGEETADVVASGEVTTATKTEKNTRVTAKASDKQDNQKTEDTKKSEKDKKEDTKKTGEKADSKNKSVDKNVDKDIDQNTDKNTDEKTSKKTQTSTSKSYKNEDGNDYDYEYSNRSDSYPEPYYDRTMAESIWGMVNEERTANGLNALAWDETAYNFACNRCLTITVDFSHNGCEPYGENILMNPNMSSTASTLHMQWYNSEGHHTNYMTPDYASGACAVYFYNGRFYAVENFTRGEQQGRWFEDDENGLYYDSTWTDESNQPAVIETWFASNGVKIELLEGGTTLNVYTYDDNLRNEAVDEYYATHGMQ